MMRTKQMESTVHISDTELQATLQDFLEEKEKKTEKSIWNITTISGLAFVFTAFAFIGHTIATDIIGLQPISGVYTLMTFMPYLAGALLGVNILTMFKSSSSKEKKKEREEEIKVQETYDKLDAFLYSEKEQKKNRKSSAFRVKEPLSTLSINAGQKLFKSRSDKYISGVCGGLAKYLGINSTVIRMIFLAALFLGYGSFFLVYIALSIVMPKEPISLMDDFN
jgi:phage shock protein C